MCDRTENEPLTVNMVVNFFAAAVFATFMCGFWWFVASQEVVSAVKRKAEVLYSTRQQLDHEPLLSDLAVLLDGKMNQLQKENAAAVGPSEAYRMVQNRKLLWMWMGPLIAVYVGLMLAFIVFNQTRTHYADDPRHFTFGHGGGLVLVFFSYIPEILFFLYVVELLVPMGDYEIMQRVLGFEQYKD
jgi:hypothetical protein